MSGPAGPDAAEAGRCQPPAGLLEKLAGPLHAKARAATIRRDLIAVAARAARHGRGNLTIHLPEYWHREHEWLTLWHASAGPPPIAA